MKSIPWSFRLTRCIPRSSSWCVAAELMYPKAIPSAHVENKLRSHSSACQRLAMFSLTPGCLTKGRIPSTTEKLIEQLLRRELTLKHRSSRTRRPRKSRKRRTCARSSTREAAVWIASKLIKPRLFIRIRQYLKCS